MHLNYSGTWWGASTKCRLGRHEKLREEEIDS